VELVQTTEKKRSSPKIKNFQLLTNVADDF
jgi:hypothetical protein